MAICYEKYGGLSNRIEARPVGSVHRKRWFFAAMGAMTVPVALGLAIAYSQFIEARWLKTVHLDLSGDSDSLLLVHITDIHYKGDREYLQTIIRRVNGLKPDLVCFTGDLVESSARLDEALDLLASLEAPVYAVPGNHEYWSGGSLAEINASLAKRGGRLLVNEWASVERNGRRLIVVGVDDMTGGRPDVEKAFPPEKEREGATLIVLTHSPKVFDQMGGVRFDLGLAGHSHGGQVRLPLVGAIITPDNVGAYDKGMHGASSGPVYVNPGIGTWRLPLRLMCRPEITCVKI